MFIFVLILFLIWPFGGAVAAFGGYSGRWSKNILWLFVIFYGYTFVLSNDTMDANRIKEKFETIIYSGMSLTDVVQFYLLESSDGVDIIQPLIFYAVSNFTVDFYILMAVLGGIFGYYYSRNICYLLDQSEGKLGWYSILLVYLFSVIIGFWDINRFRFATATMIFFYATIPYIYEGKTKRIWLLPLSFLMHFSYLFPLAVLLIYRLFKNRVRLYFIGFIVSFFLTSINATTLGEILQNLLPSNFHYKIMAYTNENYVKEQAENVKSISYFLRYAMFFIINGVFVLLYIRYKERIRKHSDLFRLFNFSLLMMASANFISIIPSGIRFLSLSALYSLTFMVFYFQREGIFEKEKLLIHISVPVFLFSSFGYIRLGFNTIDIITVIGNPVVAFFNETRVALIELL